jgi:hypothetical protein
MLMLAMMCRTHEGGGFYTFLRNALIARRILTSAQSRKRAM